MPAAWMPGVIADPGKGAGYAVGRNRMEIVKVHKTAGNNSYNVVKNGVSGAPSTLAQFLVPYEGVPWQFTEADALCYDSGPYNDDGPGIEIEAPVTGGLIRPGLSEFRDLSPSQIEWTGKIVRWLHDEWGVPLDLYDGPRFGSAGFRGFVNHGDLDNQRTDGVTPEEWVAMTAGAIDWAAIVAYLEATDMTPDQDKKLTALWDMYVNNTKQGTVHTINQTGVDVASLLTRPSGPGGGLSEAQVRAVIRDELNKTKLAG